MRTHIMNFVKTIILTLMCSVSLVSPVKVFADSPTINPNPNFVQDYYLTAGQTYAQGTADLTYKMINVPGQEGMYISREGSILLVHILSVTGLPAGLTFTAYEPDRNQPTLNTLYFSGTLPATTAPGVYTVSVEGQDAARTRNKATQVIRLHIGGSVPQRGATSNVQVIGTVGGAPDPLTTKMSAYFQSIPGASAIDSYEVTNLPSNFGVSLNPTSGDFVGTYATAGTFPDVLVYAHNQAGLSLPVNVTFVISQADAPPTFSNSSSATVNGTVGSTSNLSQYFKTASTSSPITNYHLVSSTLSYLPAGITGITAQGDLVGTYTTAQTINGLQVQAENAAGLSDPLTVKFIITAINVPTAPVIKDSNYQVVVNSTVGAAAMNTVNTNPNDSSDHNVVDLFTVAQGSPAITSTQISNGAANDPNISLVNNYFSGTYSVAGSYTMEVTAQNSVGTSAPKVIQFNIAPAVIQPTAPTLQNETSYDVQGVVGGDSSTVRPMSQFFQASANAPITSYVISGPALPQGVTFHTTTDATGVMGTFTGTYTAATLPTGIQGILISAVNSVGTSLPLTMSFTITAAPPAPVTFTCPTTQQVTASTANNCAPITVNDSNLQPHVFTNSHCTIFAMVGFTAAELGTNGSHSQGLVCNYKSMANTVWMYYLDPVPTGTYYGNNVTNTTCTAGVAACQFNIP